MMRGLSILWHLLTFTAPSERTNNNNNMVTTTQKTKATSSKICTTSAPPTQFTNPVAEGADPWVVADPENHRYLWCKTDGDQAIVIRVSDRLTSMGSIQKHTIWRSPDTGPAAFQVWAPELHRIDDRWYVYFSASWQPPHLGEEGHRAFVLKSRTSDPIHGGYDLHGPLATGDGSDGRSPNRWAIDMTTFVIRQQRYAVWSGWEAPGTRQFLYIAPMRSPTEMVPVPRTKLCHNEDYDWEKIHTDSHGLNEGPQSFQHGNENGSPTTCVLFSCGASCKMTYKLGLLEYDGSGDPLQSSSWRKWPDPIFDRTASVGGIGHSCLVPALHDPQEWWHVFHAKQDREFGWRRAIHVQPVAKIDRQGRPHLGRPIDAGVLLDRPAGEAELMEKEQALPFGLTRDLPWLYYGHWQYSHWDGSGGDDSTAVNGGVGDVHLGREPTNPTNAYRTGEKLVLGRTCPNDLELSATMLFCGPNAQEHHSGAGLLFRCSAPAVGYHAQRGYFAGVVPRKGHLRGAVVLGLFNGKNWEELAVAEENVTVDVSRPQKLTVRVVGDRIDVLYDHQARLSVRDDTYLTGTVGLRVIDTHTIFHELVGKEAQPNHVDSFPLSSLQL